jgi:hypothetical protein
MSTYFEYRVIQSLDGLMKVCEVAFDDCKPGTALGYCDPFMEFETIGGLERALNRMLDCLNKELIFEADIKNKTIEYIEENP